jgi:hypothetical protein
LDDYAQELAGAIRLNSAILTNGAPLRPAYIEQIKQHGMRLAIPLDGLGAAHDTQRPLLGGQPSFPQVQRGLDLAAILSATFARVFHPFPMASHPACPVRASAMPSPSSYPFTQPGALSICPGTTSSSQLFASSPHSVEYRG